MQSDPAISWRKRLKISRDETQAGARGGTGRLRETGRTREAKRPAMRNGAFVYTCYGAGRKAFYPGETCRDQQARVRRHTECEGRATNANPCQQFPVR